MGQYGFGVPGSGIAVGAHVVDRKTRENCRDASDLGLVCGHATAARGLAAIRTGLFSTGWLAGRVLPMRRGMYAAMVGGMARRMPDREPLSVPRNVRHGQRRHGIGRSVQDQPDAQQQVPKQRLRRHAPTVTKKGPAGISV